MRRNPKWYQQINSDMQPVPLNFWVWHTVSSTKSRNQQESALFVLRDHEQWTTQQINRNCNPNRQIFVLELLKTFELNSLFSKVHNFSFVSEGIYEIVTFSQTWQASILYNYHYRSTDPYFFGLDRICKLNILSPPLTEYVKHIHGWLGICMSFEVS